MENVAVIAMLPLLLIGIGYGLLWGYSYLHHCRKLVDGQVAAYVLKVLGWLAIVAGFCSLTWFAFVFAWIALAVILLGAVHLYRVSEGQSLTTVLLASAQRGVPMEVAARSFARERHGLTAKRARRLAAYLDAAVPLSNSLKNARVPVAGEMLLAVDMGERSGRLPETVASILEHWRSAQLGVRSMLEKIFYLTWIVVFAFGVVTFIMIKIMPVFAKMFEDFGLALPAATKWLIQISQLTVTYWFLFGPLWLAASSLLLASVLAYAGISYRYAPLLNRLFAPMERSAALRLIAVGVRNEDAVPETLRQIAAFTRAPSIRRQLTRALDLVEGGTEWSGALQRTRFLRSAEAALLRSAEQSGNLPWALEEMARGTLRRFTLRFRAWVSISFPLVIVTLAGLFGFIAAAVMFPLFDLIEKLT